MRYPSKSDIISMLNITWAKRRQRQSFYQSNGWSNSLFMGLVCWS